MGATLENKEASFTQPLSRTQLSSIRSKFNTDSSFACSSFAFIRLYFRLNTLSLCPKNGNYHNQIPSKQSKYMFRFGRALFFESKMVKSLRTMNSVLKNLLTTPVYNKNQLRRSARSPTPPRCLFSLQWRLLLRFLSSRLFGWLIVSLTSERCRRNVILSHW
jgi:hypothetical protein